jgi:hypothetical protein
MGSSDSETIGPTGLPVARWGRLQWDDAEDVSSATFQVILSVWLLERWLKQPTARLRTLLCSVVRNVLSNRT